jgi:integrase
MKNAYELWINQVTESETTKRRYLIDVTNFERWAKENYDLNVRDLPSKWREAKYNGEVEREKFLDQLNDILKDYFAYLKGHVTPLSVKRTMSAIMSFLHAFDVPIKPLRVRYPYVVYHNRDITKEEIKQILENSDVRNRAIWLMLYESGMRPTTLVNLKWKHIKNDFGKVPMKIDLTSDILKCRVSQRFSFIGEEGFKALKTYLATRLPLKDNDLVFVPEKGSDKLTSQALSQAFNKLVLKLKLAESQGKKPKDLRLYCLRKAFRKFMASAVDSAYVEFWMGHTSTTTHYLSMDIEHHRRLYQKGYENLRLYEIPSEDLAKLKLENIELRMQVEELGKRLEALERLLSKPSLQIDKEALETTEKLAKRLPKQYVAED